MKIEKIFAPFGENFVMFPIFFFSYYAIFFFDFDLTEPGYWLSWIPILFFSGLLGFYHLFHLQKKYGRALHHYRPDLETVGKVEMKNYMVWILSPAAVFFVVSMLFQQAKIILGVFLLLSTVVSIILLWQKYRDAEFSLKTGFRNFLVYEDKLVFLQKFHIVEIDRNSIRTLEVSGGKLKIELYSGEVFEPDFPFFNSSAFGHINWFFNQNKHLPETA